MSESIELTDPLRGRERSSPSRRWVTLAGWLLRERDWRERTGGVATGDNAEAPS